MSVHILSLCRKSLGWPCHVFHDQDSYRSSTLENWCREFARFAPSISIQTYYAGKEERPALRQTLLDTQRHCGKNDSGWEVLITTYNLAQGDDKDRKFFRRIEWDVSILGLWK